MDRNIEIQFSSLMGGVNIAFPKLVRLPEICYRKDTPLIHCLTATSAGLGSQIEKQVAEEVCRTPTLIISTNLAIEVCMNSLLGL